MFTGQRTLEATTKSSLPIVLASIALLSACSSGGGGGGGTGQIGITGQLVEKTPGGEMFFVDPNAGGQATRIFLAETVWGRLVDVYAIDANGVPESDPVFRDFVISENTQSDGTNYSLETNPITQQTRLVILRERDMNLGTGTFNSLLTAAVGVLPPITPKGDDGTWPAPFSFMARNGCVVLRFSDCLDDSPEAEKDLLHTIKVLFGYSPELPFMTRILFDKNHGARISDEFHSTRVLIDMTVSQTESTAMANSVPVNSLGLPTSLANREDPNVSIRIATRPDTTNGDFTILRGLSGSPLSFGKREPVDKTTESQDLVRAFRAGNVEDGNNGFLLDLNPPAIVGAWGLEVRNVTVDPDGEPGIDFIVDITFASTCQAALNEGDTIAIGDLFLEVSENTASPDNDVISNVRLRSLAVDAIASSNILGAGFLQSTYDPASRVPLACWVSFAPQPLAIPATGVSTTAQVVVRFSEPIDPTSVTPFDTFMVLRGNASSPTIEAENVVVGTVAATPNLKSFSYTSILPFAHQRGSEETFNLRLGDITDLAGNALRNTLPALDFTLAPLDPDAINSSVVLRFSDLDEVRPVSPEQGVDDDLRGQIFYDLERGVIKPREASFNQYAADPTNPVPSIMIPFPPGIQTPLSNRGSRLMALWRYVDLGWNAADETKYNLDVYGLNWSPAGGSVLRDHFQRFEILLSHSKYLPDEDIDQNLLPKYRSSGLLAGPRLFTENIQADPLSPQTVVHSRALGYTINPSDVFRGLSGTLLVPYPLNNQGGDTLSTWTWRDTAALTRGGFGGTGVPLDIESGLPLQIVGPNDHGKLWAVGKVPTAGLPLLIDFKCFPSDSAFGLNALSISLAINSSARPNFRAYSTGGVNTSRRVIKRNPDGETSPQGGFNPTSRPRPGARTAQSADNTFYNGQLDVVIRISRAHTVWIDTTYPDPVYLAPVLEPTNAEQPPGTSVVLDFRGVNSFSATAASRAFNSASINAYGNVIKTNLSPPVEVPIAYFPAGQVWRAFISTIDTAQYFQMRLTFVNNIAVTPGLTPELSAIGVAFVQE